MSRDAVQRKIQELRELSTCFDMNWQRLHGQEPDWKVLGIAADKRVMIFRALCHESQVALLAYVEALHDHRLLDDHLRKALLAEIATVTDSRLNSLPL